MALKEKSRDKGEKSAAKSGESRKGRTRKDDTPEIRLGSLLGPDSLLQLVVESKEELLRALSETVAIEKGYPSAEQIYRSAMERESVVNTYLGEGVAVPHARVSSFDGFAIAIARNEDGFPYGVETDQPVRIVILLVGNEAEQRQHVRLLAAIASAFRDEKVPQEILAAADAPAVARILDSGARGSRRRPHQLTKQLLSHARKIARDVGATSVLVAINNPEELSILRRLPRRDSFIVATRSARIADSAEKLVQRVIRLPRMALGRDTLARVGALMGVSKGFISRDDVVAFISGKPGGVGLDTITILGIWREFGRFLTASGEVSPDISPGVLERVLILASELGVEGREGKPLGTIFVIGDPEELGPYCQQLVINPFRGYPEEERNILDPTLRETVKEFSSIDGAFIIRGDGLIHAAGTYLRPGDVEVQLPGGYGTRHRAACAITAVAECVAITISESTGQFMLFKKGAVVLTTDKDQGG